MSIIVDCFFMVDVVGIYEIDGFYIFVFMFCYGFCDREVGSKFIF